MTEEAIQELVKRAIKGDSESAGLLYDAFQHRMYTFFLYRVKPKEAAEDLTQIVFLEMIQSLPRYKTHERAPFSTWLFKIARHRLIDHYRQQRKTVSLDTLSPDDASHLRIEPDDISFDSRNERVQRALEQLPKKYKNVLQMSFIEHMEPSEIAAILNITAMHVRVLKYRGLKKLKDTLNQSQ